MKILFVTAGAAGMYCGSCLRDNALAAELKSKGAKEFVDNVAGAAKRMGSDFLSGFKR
jgi:hypothetical protein